MTPEQHLLARIAVLQSLVRHENGVPLQAVHTSVVLGGHRVDVPQTEAWLTQLAQKSFVCSYGHPIHPDVQLWRITALGRSVLDEALGPLAKAEHEAQRREAPQP